jgi:RNase P subunit RPR2
MLRRLRCWVRGHDWNITDHDQVTQRVTQKCSKCGARRRYVVDPREPKIKYGYPGADDSGIGHGGG